MEIGGNGWGNQYINLIPQDGTNSAAGSQVIQDPANNRIEFVFRYTIDPSHGDNPAVDMRYYHTYAGFTEGWASPPLSYVVDTGGTIATSFNGLTIDQPTVTVNTGTASDVQVARMSYTVNNPASHDITNVQITLDYNPANGLTGTAERGRIGWTPAGGFVEIGGNGWGNQYINLIPQDGTNSAAGSQVIQDPANNRIEFVFRYTVDPSHGDNPAVDMRYYHTYAGFTEGWASPPLSYVVDTGGTIATSFNGLTIDQPTVTVNTGTASDVQVARMSYTVNNPASHDITNVQITLDYNPANGLTGTAERGRIGWTPAGGFVEIGGNGWGNQYINLIPQDGTNSAAGSQVIQDPANNRIEFVFRYTIDPSHGDNPAVDMRYYHTYAGFTEGWASPPLSYVVDTGGTIATSFNGLTIDQPTVTVNTGTASDVQVARMSYTVNNPASHDITNVQITLDYNPANGLTGTAERGRIGWTPAEDLWRLVEMVGEISTSI
ncbi:hypothetical protein IPJ72_03095 [Candidatus Peregrinibacteria bacterium]|nr:MAG: hypothetical protein IPJ72_03095 [Candidatus Peregrinibacteria bacterium]